MKKGQSSKIPNHIQFDTVSPATKLLEKRRQMYEVHEAFETQKEQYKNQEDAFKKQEEIIRDRDLQIQEDLITYCKFLQDNEAKKARAEKRYHEEHEARIKKEQDIELLNVQLQELQKNSSKLERKVQSLKKYEDYLDLVIKEHSDQYSDLGELLQRHFVLENSHKNLKKQQQDLENELERLRTEAAQFEKEKSNEILLLNNDLARLQKELDEVDNRKNDLQSQVEASSNDASSKNLSLGRILMAIDNLHSRCEEGVVRIKEDAKKETEKAERGHNEERKREEAPKPKKALESTKTMKDPTTTEEDDYLRKCEKAIDRLKKIGAMMSDFQDIIKECRDDDKSKKKR
jgi:chromosome segregation ATPase